MKSKSLLFLLLLNINSINKACCIPNSFGNAVYLGTVAGGSLSVFQSFGKELKNSRDTDTLLRKYPEARENFSGPEKVICCGAATLASACCLQPSCFAMTVVFTGAAVTGFLAKQNEIALLETIKGDKYE